MANPQIGKARWRAPVIAEIPEVGTICFAPWPVPRQGWMPANGSRLSSRCYPELAEIFARPGEHVFAIPDLRGVGTNGFVAYIKY